MAYVIDCNIVDRDEDRIRVVVSFYGEDQDDAQDACDTFADTWPEIVRADSEGRLIIEESEIPDDEFPELEEEEPSSQ
jgi:hypothetical protein